MSCGRATTLPYMADMLTHVCFCMLQQPYYHKKAASILMQCAKYLLTILSNGPMRIMNLTVNNKTYYNTSRESFTT